MGIIGQGGPSINESGGCRYRGLNGRKCAIGWLIPDRENVSVEGIEGLAVDLTLRDSLVNRLLIKLGYNDISFLHQLQDVHDQAASITYCSWNCNKNFDKDFIEVFKVNAQKFAKDHQLTLPDACGA